MNIQMGKTPLNRNKMGKLLLLLVVLSCLTACEKEDNSISNSSRNFDLIQGRWHMLGVKPTLIVITAQGNDTFPDPSWPDTMIDYTLDSYYQFDENYSFTQYFNYLGYPEYKAFNLKGTYVLRSDSILTSYAPINSPGNVQFSDRKIIKLNEEELVLFWETGSNLEGDTLSGFIQPCER